MEREDGRRAEGLDRYWDAVLAGGAPDRPGAVDDVAAAVVAHLNGRQSVPADEAARERTRLRVIAKTQTMEASMMAQHSISPGVLPGGRDAFPQTPRGRPWWAAPPLATAALLALTIVMGLVTFGRRPAGPESPLSHLAAPSTQPPAVATPEASPEARAALAEFVAEIPIGAGPMSSPEGLAIGADGALYVIDSFQDQILLFDGDGQPIGAWGETGTGPGQFRFHEGGAGFGDMAIGPDGNIYVADPFNNRIQVLGPDGAFVREWGESGLEEGRLSEPHGLAIDASGRVYVADSDNSRVQIFDRDGQFLAAWAPVVDGGRRISPDDVAVDAAGIVSVSDGTTRQVLRLDENGTVTGRFGGADPASDERIGDPDGVANDAQGDLFVVDGVEAQILVFAADGSLLGKIGSAGLEPGQFITPVNVALGPDGRLYVADGGNRRVQVFQLLPPLGP